MRMIDADEAAKKIATLARIARSDQQKALLGRCMYIVEHCQTVDAVPVVKCKDCKWYDSVFFGCTKSRFSPDPDFFCACGAKLDGGAEDAAD